MNREYVHGLNSDVEDVKTGRGTIYDSQFMKRMSAMYEEKKFTDATINVVGRTKFEVHKVVLAAYSTVFAVMFEGDFF